MMVTEIPHHFGIDVNYVETQANLQAAKTSGSTVLLLRSKRSS